jgi:hypothetical protein
MDQELIKELANVAWAYASINSTDGDGTHGHLYRTKFAELLLGKCIEVIENAKIDGEYQEYVYGYNSAIRDSIRSINRTFNL